MNVNELFASKYVSTPDLKGSEVTVTIATLQIESLQNGNAVEKKGVLYFTGAEKGLVLNRCNCDTITAAYGPETDAWLGRPIVLFPASTSFQGRPTPCIRIRIPGQQMQPPAQAQPINDAPVDATAPVDQAIAPTGDGIPF
jgi:hypothetical protein